MDDKLQRQLLRQLKFLNFWLALFGSVMLIGFIVIGLLLYQVFSFARDIERRVESTQQSLNLERQACDSDSTIGELARRAGLCR